MMKPATRKTLRKWLHDIALFAFFLLSALLSFAAEAPRKDFIVYDRMDYIGKPDLTSDGLSKIFLIYESELTMPDPAAKRKHGVLNIPKIKALAKQAKREGHHTVSTDIESWFGEKDGEILSHRTLAQDFAVLFQIFKNEMPYATVGNYGIPTENLPVIRFYRPGWSNQAVLAKWHEVNKRRWASVPVSDYLYPPLYIAEPDIRQWQLDAETTAKEIRRRYPRKKIIAYLWPQYYLADNSPHFRKFIQPAIWRQMLETSYRHFDGVVIWSDKRDENGKIVQWSDPRIQAVMAETKKFIAAHRPNIRTEGLKNNR